MGGYGSGGHNKTHRKLENFHRIDSFAFYHYLMGDKYLSCKTTVQYHRGDIIYHVEDKTAEIKTGAFYIDLPLSRIHGIDGKSVRMYFHCPYCGKRVRYLYRRQGDYMCRNCAKLNYASQQKSGMDEMRLKMERIVEKNLGYICWWKDCDCIADLPVPPKPPYMRWEKYASLVLELKKLQSDYYVAFMKGMGRFGFL